MSLHQKVSSAIRILRWNRDVSARASHLVVKNEHFVTSSYESVILGQAGSRNVLDSTVFFERKLMSTKTSFKRIAAVAAVALTLGGLSAVSAHASVFADSLTNAADGSATASSSFTIGQTSPAAYASTELVWSGISTVAPGDTATVTGTILQVPAYSAAYASTFVTSAANNTNDLGTAALTGGSSGTPLTITTTGSSSQRVVRYIQARFSPDKAGTYVILVQAGNGVNNSKLLWTITVSAPAKITAAASKIIISTGSGNWYDNAFNGCSGLPVGDFYALPCADTASKTLAVEVSSTTTTGVKVLAGNVQERNNFLPSGSGPVGVVATDPNAGLPLTVSISAHGYVGIGNNTVKSTSVTESVATAGSDGYSNGFGAGAIDHPFSVFSDGTTGTATLTFSAGGIALGTRTVIFYGKATAAKVTNNYNIIAESVLGGGSGNAAAEIYVTDANNNPVVGRASHIKGTSSDATVLNSNAVGTCTPDAVTGNGYYTCDVTSPAGAASGATATMTYTVYADDNTTVLATTNASAFTLGGTKVYALTATTDADSYTPGDKVTMTFTAKDSAGNPVADSVDVSTYALFTSAGIAINHVTASAASLTGKTALAFTGGKSVVTFFAPDADTSSVNWSATLVGNTDSVALALDKTAVAGTFAVTSSASTAAQAAIDAAQEATDAANAAYDAANNAMDSADAATAAAQDASDNASAALAAVTSLSATVAKLVKSVTAIATALASIKKKLGVK